MSIVVAAGCAVAFASPVAAAGRMITLTGPYTIPPASDRVTPIGTAGGNMYFHEVAPLIYSGTLAGRSVDVDNFVVHADGSVQGAGIERCSSCTIRGRTGSFVAVFQFHGIGDSYTGSLWFIRSGGGLRGLQGGGSFAGTQSGAGGSYAYHVAFFG